MTVHHPAEALSVNSFFIGANFTVTEVALYDPKDSDPYYFTFDNNTYFVVEKDATLFLASGAFGSGDVNENNYLLNYGTITGQTSWEAPASCNVYLPVINYG